MALISFTVDVDRDVNQAVQGSPDAVCPGGCTRFSSSYEGLKIFIEVLNELGIKGTFFMEGKTAEVISADCDLRDLMKIHEIGCHGYNHEDLTGKDSGVILTNEEIKAAVERGINAVKEVFKKDPRGFRAPYLHYDDRIQAIISNLGFKYSSSTVKVDDECVCSENKILEIPVLKTRDSGGRWMQSYLWPLHEGKRSLADYKYLLLKEVPLLVLGDHSWHMVENYSGMFSKEKIKQNTEELRDILSYALDREFEFVTLEEYAERFSSSR